MAERWTGIFTVRCPEPVVEAVERVAESRASKPSEYIRQAVLKALKADGIDPLAAARAE